ncbi:MAG: P-loop NTPase [Gammaproteobacteria bacterium]|nr:P-loop NTPase [Gammaproteobacteria bacterium]
MKLALKLTILVASRDKAALEQLKTVLGDVAFDVTYKHMSNGHADPLHGVMEIPDILVLQVGANGEAELSEIVGQTTAGRPPTIIIGPVGKTACMRLAMQSGARDYLEDPVSPADLMASLQRIDREISDARPARNGSMVAVVSAKGGSGASFIAVNLAHIMTAHSKARVALLDMDLQFSSLSQYLDLEPEHGLLQALDMAEQLDSVALDAYMAKHSSGLSMIGVLQDEMVLTRDIPMERFAHLLDTVRQNYDRVVVDLPRQIDDVAAAVYDRADRVLVVMQQEIANLRDAVRLRNILVRQLGLVQDKIEIVVNRYDKNFQVELPDIRRALNCEDRDLMLVPNQYRDVSESINVGVPMMDQHRSSAVTKALMQIEARLGGGSASTAPRSAISRALANLIGA